MRTLVVYYSWTGYTKALAEAYAQKLGADIFEIQEKKTRSGSKEYVFGGFKASFKLSSSVKALPDVASYDTIYVGTPIWASKCTPAINCFFKKTALAGKKVVGFATLQSESTSAGEQMEKAALKKGGTFGGFHFLTVSPKVKPDVSLYQQTVEKWLV